MPPNPILAYFMGYGSVFPHATHGEKKNSPQIKMCVNCDHGGSLASFSTEWGHDRLSEKKVEASNFSPFCLHRVVHLFWVSCAGQ